MPQKTTFTEGINSQPVINVTFCILAASAGDTAQACRRCRGWGTSHHLSGPTVVPSGFGDGLRGLNTDTVKQPEIFTFTSIF